MSKRSQIAGLVVASALLSAGARAQPEPDVFEGRVCEDAQPRCIPDLGVSLVPPRGSEQPERVTVTDSEGRFRLVRVKDGRYLLEVRQGRDVVHRSEVDTRQSRTVMITLTRR